MTKIPYTKYATIDQVLDEKAEWQGDCLIWIAGCHTQSYPMVRFDGKMRLVARYLKELEVDRNLDRSERVRNVVCKNPLCVNPDHYKVMEHGTVEWAETRAWTSQEVKQNLRDLWYSQTKQERFAWGSQARFSKKHKINGTTLRHIINNTFATWNLK